MGRGKKRCSASACATAISMVRRSGPGCSTGYWAWTSRHDCCKETMARTYLFLHIMRLGPAACSGGTAVFFLAIGPSEGVYGANVRKERACW